MRRLIVVAVVILAVVSLRPARSSASTQKGDANAVTGFTMSFEFRGKSYSFELNAEGLSGTPGWEKPESGRPPLAVPEAIEVSKRQLIKYHPTIARWQIAGIDLSPVGTTSKWYYMISWRPEGGHVKDIFSVPVLMDGRPVTLESKLLSSS